MKTLTLKLENCYGIRKLEHALDFSKGKAIAIYAPNGSMKSSLAQIFEDIGLGRESKDRIFPNRVSTRIVQDENGADLPTDSVLVVRPYEESLEHSKQTSTLLVNAALRKEYEGIHAEIDDAKNAFLKALKDQSHSKRNLESEISLAFTSTDNKFYIALNRIRDEVANRPNAPLSNLPYDLIFDEKVQTFLKTKDFKAAVSDYIKKYNELLAASTYFKKGVFNYFNAGQIAKQLADNGFFAAKHSVNLNADEKKEISSQKELEDLIAIEKEAITKDKDLRKKFTEIEKLIQKNATLREFESFLQSHEDLLTKFDNIDEFRQEVLKAYIDARFDLYSTLLEKYQSAESRRNAIQEQASNQRTQWEEVIDIFNSRFDVPFKLQAINKVDVILGQHEMLNLGFSFSDGVDQVPVDRSALVKSLSTGEKKALYVLNVLFDIEVRKKLKSDTLIVVDDIADSFDYKNKYAIIQYLKDISECQQFQQIILTHNFDFYRTIAGRFVGYNNCLMAAKSDAGVVIERAAGINNVFINDWKKEFYSDSKKKIASIAFIRNLVEYVRGNDDPSFVKLTSLLHWKAGSQAITVAELDTIYNDLFSSNDSSPDNLKSVVELILIEAENCLVASDGINFANKVILAIAIRLVAEQFMIDKINDPVFVAGITSNQTSALLNKYKTLPHSEQRALDVLQRVALMTPENIHLNSFMYEPILDMSDHHLRTLYQDVQLLLCVNGENP